MAQHEPDSGTGPDTRPWDELVSATPTLPDPMPPVVLADDERLVVLDDDPTGNQSVHDVLVLARFDTASLREVLTAHRTVFLLTNSRALSEDRAVELYRTIGVRLRALAGALGLRLRIASRSDSTLRGHFPAEVVALQQALGLRQCLLVPSFVDGGRVTIDDVHWVRDGERAVPVGRTPYSRDPTFAFTSSWLPAWVEEKTEGAVVATSVGSVPLESLRSGSLDEVVERLRTPTGSVIVGNAACDLDLRVLAHAVAQAEAAGASLVYRCGASFVRERAGIEPQPLLTGVLAPPARGPARGGLIVVGSHVPNTTVQLQRLLERPDTVHLTLEVETAIGGAERSAGQVQALARAAAAVLRDGRHAVIATSRTVVERDGVAPLEVASRVSTALVDTVRALPLRPAFLVAKGGITSHDVATRALGMGRATVLGQVVPGVPVWRLLDGPSAGMAYVVFPGNVGTPHTLAEVVGVLAGTAAQGSGEDAAQEHGPGRRNAGRRRR